MQTLQEYIFENYDIDNITEGKILDIIKNWFKKLFDPTEKKYDRYADTFNDNDNLRNYKDYIDSSFNIKDIKLINITSTKDLKYIVDKTIINNDTNSKQGFYRFYPVNKHESLHDVKYISFVYNNENVKDVCALFKYEIKDSINSNLHNYIKILNMQILPEYEHKFSIESMINLIHKKFEGKYTVIYISKNYSDKKLFKTLHDECNFINVKVNKKEYLKYVYK